MVDVMRNRQICLGSFHVRNTSLWSRYRLVCVGSLLRFHYYFGLQLYATIAK